MAPDQPEPDRPRPPPRTGQTVLTPASSELAPSTQARTLYPLSDPALSELGLEGRFAAVIEEVSRVRAELGYPIMVTPFPQMVMGQALSNVLSGSRYSVVPDQVIRYVGSQAECDRRAEILLRKNGRDMQDRALARACRIG